MNKLGIMQPYFLPYLGYFQLINAVDKYVLYDDVNYIKGGWINRNNILINGAAHLITLSLEDASSFKKINEIQIKTNNQNREKIVRTIKLSYSRAPYFDFVMPFIEKSILNSDNIAELNYKLIVEINKYLEIDTEIILSSNLDKNNNLKGEEKVIHINKLLGADTYINAFGGTALYDKENFKKEGIELKFLKMNDIEYKQFKNKFVPNLSIVDVLMFNSKDEVRELLNRYELI